MRRNELRTARGFIDNLISLMEDVGNWGFMGKVKPVFSADGMTATVTDECDRPIKFTFNNFDKGNFARVWGWQQCQFEDDYYGEMLIPIEGGDEYLRIWYQG